MVWPSLQFVVFGLAALNGLVSAHPGEADEVIHPADVGRRQLEAMSRQLQARNCAPQIAAHLAGRKAKRTLAGKPNMRRRGPDSVPQGTALWRRGNKPRDTTLSVVAATGIATPTASADGPKYTSIQNSTCLTAPEVAEGPYFVNNELLRSDLRETQPGVDLLLDIGVIDTTTCQPLDQALVEIWSCNATGSYAGFTTIDDPTALVANMTDQFTFLRGGVPTNENGILEFKTIYPGFYTGRTIHIHTVIQTNYTVFPNGTVGTKLGDTHHIGQVFFNEELNNQILAQPAYLNTTQTRTLNTEDTFVQDANVDGYNAFADTELLGETVADGILAYITIGIDTTRQINVTSTNYASTIVWGATTPIATATDAGAMF